ncbi:site-specific integrase [Pelomonas aquatica]|uniref:Site-specific integrase n=1 Tax=Pelomonas aquatica TaxID=431058 RepID=A0A9X4R4C2_9BURK|nr:integrase [Pelomonas aquatica]MCY4755485.1 integrase [Pelomonas aquatica]MDG0862301.1 site-specific integrase [Pelomonas aquatica]
MSNLPSTERLPVLQITRVSETPEPNATSVHLSAGSRERLYYRAPVASKTARGTKFFKFPVVKNGDGSPWAVACLYLLDRAKLRPLAMETLGSVAGDLAHYKSFLEEFEYEWDEFHSAEPYALPTYQYRAHLLHLLKVGSTSHGVASRRMAAVIAFYRHLQKQERYGFRPAFSPWQDRSVSITYKDAQGFEQSMGVKTTDISIPVPNSSDPWDASIDDGAKLRPLPQTEQQALISALRELGNTEMSLMHETALLTGARAQTILTFRLKHFSRPPAQVASDYKLRCGPGTGIDTKRSKSGVYLTIPKLFYERLYTYAQSERARRRREKSVLGDAEENYLFLTQHGKPYYEGVDERNSQRENDELLKSAKIAQGLRNYILERVIPLVRKKLSNPDFSYRFHDLRATFGMNFVDFFEKEVEGNPEKRKWVMHQLRELMWHKNVQTTMKYIDYRRNLHMLKSAEEGWGTHLIKLLSAREEK